MKTETALTRMFSIEVPVIMAPMFLVSNEAMMQAALKTGILGCFPTLNYRKKGELRDILEKLHAYRDQHAYTGHIGVNLIVQKTNPLYREHLDVCVQQRIAFFITSLG